MSSSSQRVVIAGGGVAGLEALLGLSRLAPELIDTVLLAPAERFVYRPLLVAEPFGVGHAVELDLDRVSADAGARLHRDALSGVDAVERRVRTKAGEELRYDALLLALGARPVEAVPGSITFGDPSGRARFAELLARLGQRAMRRVAFVVPREATWTIAAYELALLTAAERDARRLQRIELSLVTHEREPLGLLGPAAARLVRELLATAGIELHAGRTADRVHDDRLLGTGEHLEIDAAVALPALEVPEIDGLPQGARGFVVTDEQMHVAGLEHVWAAGDVTAFPVKQGGLAAQQADIAARGIAAMAGAQVASRAFQPVLRAALLSGGETQYLRTAVTAAEPPRASEQPLWTPTGKLAAGHLGAYLSGEDPGSELADLDPAEDGGADPALRLLLQAADADASAGDLRGALDWIALAEELNLVIPARYVARRDEWRHRLDPSAAPDPTADRLGGRFATAAEAMSDLRRRIGWLRETESSAEAEMTDHLRQLEEGMKRLESLSVSTGILPKHHEGTTS